MKTAVQAELPEELVLQARSLVENGWAKDLEGVLTEALRRYVESHSGQLGEAFIREDLEWGLHGKE